jgi:hypothetical protein
MNISDQIREYVRVRYVEPARLTRSSRFAVPCGTVQRELGVSNGIAEVRAALNTPKFLDPNGLRLVETNWLPSGTSTTVVYEFRDFVANAAESTVSGTIYATLRQMEGILKDAYKELAGADQAIREEREGYGR